MKSCFFIGHEYVPKHLEPRLESTVEQFIEDLFVEEYVVADHYYHHQRLKEMLCRVPGQGAAPGPEPAAGGPPSQGLPQSLAAPRL